MKPRALGLATLLTGCTPLALDVPEEQVDESPARDGGARRERDADTHDDGLVDAGRAGANDARAPSSSARDAAPRPNETGGPADAETPIDAETPVDATSPAKDASAPPSVQEPKMEPPPKLPLGSTCRRADVCESAICADSLCCAQACKPCERCTASGACEPISANGSGDDADGCSGMRTCIAGACASTVENVGARSASYLLGLGIDAVAQIIRVDRALRLKGVRVNIECVATDPSVEMRLSIRLVSPQLEPADTELARAATSFKVTIEEEGETKAPYDEFRIPPLSLAAGDRIALVFTAPGASQDSCGVFFGQGNTYANGHPLSKNTEGGWEQLGDEDLTFQLIYDP